MSNEMILYDLARKGRCTCWSPHVWKARLVLNYKNIPYRTEWLNHTEIPVKIKALGVEPNTSAQGSPYSLPTIQLPDSSAIMDSLAIAAKLESLHPEPPLHLDNGLHNAVGPIMGKIAMPLMPILFHRIGRDVVVESTQAWFEETRSKRFGMSLEEAERTKGGQHAWDAADSGIAELNKFVAEHKQDKGPFVLGSQVSYVDFVLAAMLESVRRIGQDIFDTWVQGRDELRQLHAACQQWMDKDQ